MSEEHENHKANLKKVVEGLTAGYEDSMSPHLTLAVAETIDWATENMHPVLLGTWFFDIEGLLAASQHELLTATVGIRCWVDKVVEATPDVVKPDIGSVSYCPRKTPPEEQGIKRMPSSYLAELLDSRVNKEASAFLDLFIRFTQVLDENDYWVVEESSTRPSSALNASLLTVCVTNDECQQDILIALDIGNIERQHELIDTHLVKKDT